MSKNTVPIIEPAPKPRVLILGNSPLSPSLSLELLKKECDVMVASELPPPAHLFDYIFQFSEFDNTDKVVKKYLKSRGKILLIESNKEQLPPLFDSPQNRFIRLGDMTMWDEKEAISLILKMMFRRGKSSQWDFRRGLPQYIPQKLPPEESVDASNIVSFKEEKDTEKENIPQDFSYIEESHTSLFSIISKIILGVFVLLVIITGIFYFLIKDLNDSLEQLRTHEKSLKWNLVTEDITLTLRKLNRIHTGYEIVSAPLFPFKGTKLFSDLETVFTEGENVLSTAGQTLSVLKQIEDKSGQSHTMFLSPTFPVDTAMTQIIKLKDTVSTSQKKLEKVSLPYFPKETSLSYLSSISHSLDAMESILPIAAEFSKNTQRKTYLVLFQNNLELRPTGGFIGSYGLLTLESGNMSDFKIFDVYQADGQLKGHVEPPKPIRDYMNQPNWFLRDSNWDPDFAISADRAMWFLEKETGEKVDGVIGVNLYTIEALLKITGPLKLSDFGGQEVNSDNFIQTAAQARETLFFPGSTVKKDFLTSVANTLFTTLTVRKDTSVISLINTLYQGFEEKQILVFDKDAEIEKLFENRGWAGRISSVVCSENVVINMRSDNNKVCSPDYLGIVEANLGINKVNSFITKTVTVTKKLTSENKLLSSVIVSYENKSTGNGDQKSTYLNYLRILLPYLTTVTNMSINGVKINDTQIIQERYGSDKLSVGFLLKLAASNKAVVKLEYQSPLSLAENTGSYQLLFQKQSGDRFSPLIFSFTYPDSTHTVKTLNFPNASGIEKEIYYTTDTSVDRIFALEIK